MGFGHRVYRAEDPRSRLLKRVARGARRAATSRSPRSSRRSRSRRLQERSPDRVLATNVEFYSAVVLDVAEIPPPLAPADVRLLARRRLVGAHPRAEAHRAAVPALGALRRPARPARSSRLERSPRPPPQPDALAGKGGAERELADLRAQWADELEAAARSADYRERAVAYRAIGQFRFRQKLELLRRGLEDESPACRGSALVSLELLSRDHPRAVNDVRPLLHALANADDNEAVRRLAIVSLCGTARRSATRSSCSSTWPRTTRRSASCARRRKAWPRSCGRRSSDALGGLSTRQPQTADSGGRTRGSGRLRRRHSSMLFCRPLWIIR